MTRFLLCLSLVDCKVWGIYIAVEEKKYVALGVQAAASEGKTTGFFSLTFLHLVLLTVGGSWTRNPLVRALVKQEAELEGFKSSGTHHF